VQQLLDELLASQGRPEDVCSSCPELLPQVRERWQEIRRAQAELDALFPPRTEPDPRSAASPAGQMPLPVIPGYEIEAVLGVGGMGVVFRARHVRLNRLIALKMALAGAYAGPQERERFHREAEAVAGLRHPNVVQVYDVGDSDGRPYYTMEYVEGGSLAQKLVGTPYPAREAATLVATLAGAVHAAHVCGIVHRDLKPANVLLTADGTPKVSDFGLARRLGGEAGLTQTGAVLGTPSYMAPEQAAGKIREIGPAVDIYALGVILYELLTGRPPFCAETSAETLLQVMYQDPVPPSWLNGKVPRDLETICLKCLQKEPHRRYTSAATLAEDLRRYLLGQVVEARPVGLLERARKWIRRNKVVAGLSAAAVFMLVAGTVVSLLFAFEARRQEGLATERAGQLERQSIELKAQTHAATENARHAREQEEEVRRGLIASLMIPIEGNAHPLNQPPDNTEVVGLCQLRKAPRDVRVQFLDTALRDPETARRVGRRADWVIQASIGCDRDLRDEVAKLLIQRIQKPETTPEVVLACARLGQAANLEDRKWAERSADALSAALCDKELERGDCRTLAGSLAAVLERLPRAQAAEHAARVTDRFLNRWEEPTSLYIGYENFGPAIEILAPHLGTEANRTAGTIESIFRRAGPFPHTWVTLAKAQLAVCKLLPPADAAAYVNRMVDIAFDLRSGIKEKDKFQYTLFAEILGTLAGLFDATVAGRAGDAIIAILGDSYRTGQLRSDFLTHVSVADALARVAERLDPPASLRAAEGLISLLPRVDQFGTTEPLSKALVALCRRLDANGAKRVAEAIALTIQDPKTPALARSILANGFAVVADKLEPHKTALLESGIVDVLAMDLAETKPFLARRELGQTLGSLCGRPGAKSAARAAEALTAAIQDPQTSPELLRPFAAALAEVSGQLQPAQASSHASKAAEVFGSLWPARTKYYERASLALATAEVWTYLSPHERATRARRMAADLGDAIQDPKTEPYELKSLSDALSAVCSQLDPAEGEARINSAVDVLTARLRKTRNTDWKSAPIPVAAMTLWLRLDRNHLARVADTVFPALGEPDGQRYWLEFQVDLLKKVAARLDEKDLERLLDQPLTARTVQRAILDVLGESKNRHFRNTWDYLDWKRLNDN
jgi:hypothetical protein